MRRWLAVLASCLLVLAGLLCWNACSQTDAEPNWYATFGSRDIDKLPKSHYAEPEDDLTWDRRYWPRERETIREIEEPEAFELQVYLKDLFRVGEAGLERLVVVEARCPEGDEGPAQLALRDESEVVWSQQVTWLGANYRMRPYWLPVGPKDALRLALRRGEQDLATTDAALGDDAPNALLEARPLYPIPAVDAGYALLPGSELVVQGSGAFEVRYALRGAPDGVVEMRAYRRRADGTERFMLPHQARPSEGGICQSARLQAPGEPGAYSMRVAIFEGEETIAEQVFGLHVVDPEPEVEFGATYTDLRYTPPVETADGERTWDELWEDSDKQDVVVSFADSPGRFVFWRGANYVGCWALPEAWMTYEWLEAEPDFYGAVGCVEPLQDKNCEHCTADILESSPARVAVSWAYDLVDLELKVIRGEHAEEIFTFYPDGIGTRYLRAFYDSGWHETQEFIVINRPGRWPSQALDPQAVTFISPDGEAQRPTWPKPGFSLSGWPQVVAIVNIVGGPRPFMVTPDAPYQVKAWADPYVGKPDIFNWYPHWPVTRGMKTSWLDDPGQARNPTHSNLANLVNDPIRALEGEKDFLWLIGLADQTSDATDAARCWLRPGEITGGEGVQSAEYSQAERAYVISAITIAGPDALEFVLTPEPDVPVVNPAFIIDGWLPNVEGVVEGAEEVRAAREGGRTIIWARGRFEEPTTVTVVRRRG